MIAASLMLVVSCGRDSAPPPGPTQGAAPTVAQGAGGPAGAVNPATSLPSQAPVQRGGILTLANRDDPPSGFDSLRTSSIALHHVVGSVFGPGNLVMRCRENMYLVCPYLATEWVWDPVSPR